MECATCKGNVRDKLTTFTVDLDSCAVIVRGVPSQVCEQCGEVSYTWDVSKQLEKIVKAAQASIGEVVFVTYGDNAA